MMFKNIGHLSQDLRIVRAIEAAAAAALATDDQNSAKAAWKAAMQARMAKNCEMILNDEGGIANESEKQYQMAERYLEKNE